MKNRHHFPLLAEFMTPHPLEKIIKYSFHNEALFREALTHSSASMEENEPQPSNERLEFLGDAILQLVVTEYLFHLFPELQEGDLTKLRIGLVSGDALNTYANNIDLGKHLFLGQGEESSGGRERASILGNAFEGLIGAIFLDGGLEAAKAFILSHAVPHLKKLEKQPIINNPKGELQEILQGEGKEHPLYTIIGEEGSSHYKTFRCSVTSEEKVLGIGEGSSKKGAEVAAALAALQKLRSLSSSC